METESSNILLILPFEPKPANARKPNIDRIIHHLSREGNTDYTYIYIYIHIYI